MKKLCSILLVLSLVLTVLAGCQSEPVKDNQTLAKETVENYLNALIQLEFQQAASYTGDPEKMMENSPYASIDEVAKQTIASLPEQFQSYESDIREFTAALFGAMKNSMSYRITNLIEDGEKFVATVEMTTVYSESFDLKALMAEKIEEADLQGLLMQYLENGTITTDMPEQEIYDILFPAMFDKMTESVKKLTLETVTEEKTFDVISVDGKWVIDVSDF